MLKKRAKTRRVGDVGWHSRGFLGLDLKAIRRSEKNAHRVTIRRRGRGQSAEKAGARTEITGKNGDDSSLWKRKPEKGKVFS